MSIKRLLSILAIVMLAGTILLCFAACDENGNIGNIANGSEITNNNENETTDDNGESESSSGEHTHQYNDGEIVTQATCNQSGTKKYTCLDTSCGHSYTESYSLPSYTATELYNQSVKYVGEIVTYDKSGSEYALGTGFVISSDGKIVTNYHVIEDAYSADITINDKKYTIASVLAYDADIDLAVLKIDASGLTAATICKSPVSVGSTVYAIGSSRGMTNTYSQGIITYADRVIDDISYVQHDASITHGNSGGPLINVYGKVIGINTWGISDSQNLNFAVFADELDNLVYGTPITLADLFQEQLTPYEYLTNWVLDNYTKTYFEGRVVSVEHISGDYVYSISYDLEYEYLYVDVYNDALYFSLDLIGDPSEYTYYFDYEYNTLTYTVEGIVNATTFTDNTSLTNYQYDGPSYNQANAISLTQTAMSTTISFFDYFLYTNNLGLSIEDFGFLAYNQDNTANNNNGNNNSNSNNSNNNGDNTSNNNSNSNTNDDTTKEWFIEQYSIAKNEYVSSLTASKTSKNSQISSLQSQISSYYSAYLQECQQINERCASMGMTNSGDHKSLLDTAKSNYESSISSYTRQISDLRDEIADIDAEISNPSVSNILSVLAENCGISKQQAQEYYNEYISN